MRCGLVDIPCHLWAFILSWPWWVHAGLFLCLALVLWGVGARLWSFAKGVGGWQAALGAVGALGLVLVAVWPRRGEQVATEDMFPHPDGEKKPAPLPQAKKKRKPRPTIFNMRPGSK